MRKTSRTKLATVTGKVIYSPPEGEAVLRDKLVVVHYQFEVIHPF